MAHEPIDALSSIEAKLRGQQELARAGNMFFAAGSREIYVDDALRALPASRHACAGVNPLSSEQEDYAINLLLLIVAGDGDSADALAPFVTYVLLRGLTNSLAK